MTVMPYIIVSLVASLGRLSRRQSRRLGVIGGVVLAVLWLITLLTVFVLANTLPEWKAGSFFSVAAAEEPQEMNLVSLFIPSNIFESLSQNHVPAVVLLCIFVGLALAGMPNREILILQMDILAKVLIRVSVVVTQFAPLGVFAIAASAAGTISMAEVHRLQAYFVIYTSGAIFLGLLALPALVSALTPFRYRDVLSVSKDAMLMAFATGKLIVVLPILIERTEKLFQQRFEAEEAETVPAVDVLYPVAYTFPHAGKLLSIVFVPFAAWFLGHSFDLTDFPRLLPAGLVSYFGGPLLGMPFLLDLMHLPHDMFQLFLVSGVYGERIGDAVGAMHLATFTILTTCVFLGRLRLNFANVAKYLFWTLLVSVGISALLHRGLEQTLRFADKKEKVILDMTLLDEPVESTVVRDAVRQSGSPGGGRVVVGADSATPSHSRWLQRRQATVRVFQSAKRSRRF